MKNLRGEPTLQFIPPWLLDSRRAAFLKKIFIMMPIIYQLFVSPVDDKIEEKHDANGENHGQPDLSKGEHFAAPFVNLLHRFGINWLQ